VATFTPHCPFVQTSPLVIALHSASTVQGATQTPEATPPSLVDAAHIAVDEASLQEVISLHAFVQSPSMHSRSPQSVVSWHCLSQCELLSVPV
jgi:hypothetical protein